MSNGQEAVLVAADTEEEMLPESEETALALNVEELRFWVKQVVLENIKLEKELEERKAARKMAAEICRTGKPLLLSSSSNQSQAKPAAAAAAVAVAPATAGSGKSKKKRPNGVLNEVKQDSPSMTPTPQMPPPQHPMLTLPQQNGHHFKQMYPSQQQGFGQGLGQGLGGPPLPPHVLAQQLAEQFLNSMGPTPQWQGHPNLYAGGGGAMHH